MEEDTIPQQKEEHGVIKVPPHLAHVHQDDVRRDLNPDRSDACVELQFRWAATSPDT